MKLNILATNIRLTKAISEYVTAKVMQFEKLLGKKGDIEVLVEVEVGKVSKHHKSGDVFRAEVNLTRKGKLFRAESTKDDLYKAIDSVKNLVLKELRRNKDKKASVKKRGEQKVKNAIRKRTK